MKYRSMLEGKLNETSMSKVSDKDIPDRKEADWCTKTYRVKVITPIYGGGVNAGEPDEDMPIRASAIRGQLRYWWRFLAMNRKEDKLQGEELFKEERRIWGGMGDEKELKELNEKDFSSKVFVKVMNIQNFDKRKNIYQYDKQAPQYALFPARENKGENIEAKKLIKSGIKFTMEISCLKSIDFETDIKPALRWWASFGGIGARTRRGLGSVEIETLEQVTQKESNNYDNCHLIIQDNEVDRAEEAWIKAVNTLSDFRQKPGIGRNKRQGNTPGRSKWPEPDSIREITGNHSKKKKIQRWNKKSRTKEDYQCNDHSPSHDACISFPRAAFGLPIIFKFKDEDCGEPKQTMLLPDFDDVERISSPVILTPYKKGNKYVPAALFLPAEHIYRINLKLKMGDKILNKPQNLSQEKKQEWVDKDWDNWQTNWWDSSKANTETPIKNRGIDALSAFRDFFEKGGK